MYQHFALPLLCTLFANVMASVAIAQNTSFEQLRDTVSEAVERGQIPVQEPRFDWSGEHMIYTIKPSCDIDPHANPMEQPFSAMLTVAAIRKHRYVSRDAARFWDSVLPKVEREIRRMVDLINRRRLRQEQLAEEMQQASARIGQIYHKELDALARRQGKQGAKSPARFRAIHGINVRPEPATATVKYMRSGAYLLHKHFKGETPPWNDSKWETVPQNDIFRVGDKPRFWVKWNSGQQISGLVPVRPAGGARTLVASPSRGFEWESQ